MKKVLSFVLVLSMILGSFGMAFAAAPADVVGKDYEDAVNVLTELGVVAGYKDGTYRPENVVTRAEMATFIVKAMGLADYAVGKSEFSDMAGHWADPFVAYAVSLGFVKGNTDGTFAPDATVTYDQAITMLVQAVGYKAEYMTGGYPGAFVNQAKTLGMLDGVKSGAAGANRGDVATLLYNTLDVQFVRYDADGKLDVVAMGTVDNMLKRLGGRMYNGGNAFVAGANGHTSAAKEYFGAYVTAFADKDGDILAVEEVKSVKLTGKLDGGYFVADEVKYTFTDGYKSSTGAVSNDRPAELFVNGKASGTAVSLGAVAGTVEIAANVSGKTIKEIYSITDWNVNQDAQVDETDLDAIEASTPTLLTEAFDLNTSREIDLDSFVLEGVDALEDIKEDHIVYVYKNADGISKISVGTEVVSGEVTKKNVGDAEITVNGKVYAFATDANLSNEATIAGISVGTSYDLYLDYAGDVYAFEATSAKADNYAIVIDSAAGQTGLRAEEALVQLVLADGTAKTFAFDEDAIKDGYIVTDAATLATIPTYVTKGSISNSVVKYHVNEAGKIDKMEVVTGVVTGGGVDKDITAKGTFLGMKLASDVVILTDENLDGTTALSTTEDAFAAVERAKALGKEDVVAAYKTNTSGEIVFMVMKAAGSDADVVYGFVTKVDEIADSEAEVTMLVNGEAKTYTAKSMSTFGVGTTLYAVAFDADGYAEIASASDDKSTVCAIATTDAITKVNEKVYTGTEQTYRLTLDAAVKVYKMEDGKAVNAGKADVKVSNASTGAVFYDVDEDAVVDIILVVE